jgi:hypothetical protein
MKRTEPLLQIGFVGCLPATLEKRIPLKSFLMEACDLHTNLYQQGDSVHPKCCGQRIHGNCRENRLRKKNGKEEKGKWKSAPLRVADKVVWKVLIRSEGCGLVLRSPDGTEPVVSGV